MSWLQKDSFLGAQSILILYVLSTQGPDERGGFVYFVVLWFWFGVFGLIWFFLFICFCLGLFCFVFCFFF